MIESHKIARDSGEKWPGRYEWQKKAKKKFLDLNAQSVGYVINEFCEAVSSTVVLRKNGSVDANYPCLMRKYRNVPFTNQSAKIRDGVLTLPCGRAGKLHIRMPEGVTIPGRLMEVRLHFGKVELVCNVPDEVCQEGPVIGVDLGVNTLLAATDGEKAVIVSGRATKAVVRLRNKVLGSIQSKQSGQSKGSRRWIKLQRRKYRMLDKAHRRIKDLCHKATRKVADAFPNAKAYVGEPFNDAAQKMRRVQAQQVGQACGAVLVAMLAYKLASASKVDEAYSSQTCPVCGERNKCRRIYRCSKCGLTAPRDVVGGVNIRSIGMDGTMVPGRGVPNAIRFVHPHKYPGLSPGSTRGHRASCSSQGEKPADASQ